MKRSILYGLLLAVVLSSCGTSARIEKSWRDPEATIDISSLSKVMVVAMLKNETYRRSAEDEMASLLKGKGIASYNYLNKDVKEAQEPAMRDRLKKEGFDGIVTMRLADVAKDVNYVPGSYNTYPPYYGRFWSYYWRYSPAFYEPGYYETTKTYTVEVNVFSLKRDKLIWSGVTKTVNPEGIDKLMHAAAKAVYQKMKEENFIVNS